MGYNIKRMHIGELLEKAALLGSVKEQVAFLCSDCNSPPVRSLLRMAVSPNVSFLLPTGDPPYKESELDEPGLFVGLIRKLYIFTNEGPKNIKPMRREFLFVEMLQSISPVDAKLLLLVKDKKLPEGLKPAAVKKAFPETGR